MMISQLTTTRLNEEIGHIWRDLNYARKHLRPLAPGIREALIHLLKERRRRR